MFKRKPRRRVRAVVFDFDGTISEGAEFTHQVICKTFAEFNVKPPSFKDYIGSFTAVDSIPVVEFCKAGGINASKSEIRETLDKHFKEAGFQKLRPGAEKVLGNLYALGVPLALVSRRNEQSLMRDLRHFKVLKYFLDCKGCLHVYGGREDKTGTLLYLRDYFNCRGGEIAYVGDTPLDIMEAKAASYFSVAISGGYSTPEALTATFPDLLIDELSEIFYALSFKHRRNLSLPRFLFSFRLHN